MSALAFELPPALEAQEPPEARGHGRDDVRLLIATRHDGLIVHARFNDLPAFLSPGDVLALNISATLPAAIPARRSNGTPVEIRLSTPAPGRRDKRWWTVELRSGDSVSRFREAYAGEVYRLPAGGRAELLAPFAAGVRLWLAQLELPESLETYLGRHGRPIRYRYVPREWPLEAYQNVYALEPGSAEMPSAGRPFTPELVTRLATRGIHIAPLILHTGVSSLERQEPPYPERYQIPAATARLVNAARDWGGRVVAVGTTVVRALETVAEKNGIVAAGEGWTNLVVTSKRGLRTVDGLLTGWHEPEASHLQLLRAVAGDQLLQRSYRAALEHGYLWHEFGDSHLILP